MGAAATFLRSIQTSPGRLGDVGHSLLCIHLLILTLAGTGGAEMKNHSPSHPLQLRSSCRWKNTWSRLKGRRERTHTYHSSILLFFHKCTNSFFRVLFIYLKGKGGRKRGRETSVCGCLSHTLNWGSGLQPRHVPWLGIELATLWFTDWHSIHWVTPPRACFTIFLQWKCNYFCNEGEKQEEDRTVELFWWSLLKSQI